jgi:hypothetical protein
VEQVVNSRSASASKTDAAAQDQLLEAIDKKIGEVRTEAVDLSFGEILNLLEEKEIIIDPDYQRLFRWSEEQKSRLVESVLLRLPIPPIFFIENEDGRYELIDGLQRVSSMAQFIHSNVVNKQSLTLNGCDIVPDLNGMLFDLLPLTLRLQLKRSTVRALVIKRQSKNFLRYEMFKRLNTGGSELSEQEIRNCSARIFGDDGVRFYEFLVELSKFSAFASTTATLAEVDQEKRGFEELVLRFFAAMNGHQFYHGNVAEWLSSFMEAVLLNKIQFDYVLEKTLFERAFNAVYRVCGENAFCKFKDGQPTGGLAPAYFEAVACSFAREIQKAETSDPRLLNERLIDARQSSEFRSNVGTGANKRTKLLRRIEILEGVIKSV